MNSRAWRFIFVAALCSLAAFSCKKKPKDETLPSLEGTLSFTIDRYLSTGEKVSLTPSGLTTPEGKTLTYTWKVAPKMSTGEVSKKDDGGYEYTFGDSLGVYTISCVASCTGYYSSSAYRYVTLIDPERSLSDINIEIGDQNFTDGDREFMAANIGGKWWTKANSYRDTEAGRSFYDYKILDPIFGRYYTWEEATAVDEGGKSRVCPDGWHLPTEKEWSECFASLGESVVEGKDWTGIAGYLIAPDVKFTGERMWEYWPCMDVKTRTGFSAVPVGYCNNLAGEWKNSYERAVFWTADSADDDFAYFREIIVDKGEVFIGRGDKKSLGASVRCVKE